MPVNEWLDYYFDNLAEFNISTLDLLFAYFILTMVIFGLLLHYIEQFLPVAVRQMFRYGKHKYSGEGNPIVSLLEVPKKWFAHFYIFALGYSMILLYLILKTVITKKPTSEVVMLYLDIWGGRHREVQLNTTCATVAITLMTLQCARRFYETSFVQIFSKKSKINLTHYLVGYLHYFGSLTAILTNTEGFVKGSTPTKFTLNQLSVLQLIAIIFFYCGFYYQYKSNMIFVNLRKDQKTGMIKDTEQHSIPKGGLFDKVTSPHMLCEIIMYFMLSKIINDSITWRLIAFWVLSNQVMNALFTHQWYKKKFKNYPSQRKAIFPLIL